MQKNSIIITVVVAVIVGAAAFFGGMQYQKMQRGSLAFGGAGGAGRFGNRAGGANGGSAPVTGQIISSGASSITVKLSDGSSKIIILSQSTAINKQASGTTADLKTGTNVLVLGTTNSDGSVTAQTIQLNPMMRGFGGARPSAMPSGSPSGTTGY